MRQARTVLAEAQRLLALATEGRGLTPDRPAVAGRDPDAGAYFFPLILRPLREAFPLLDPLALRIAHRRNRGRLRDGRIDAALVSLPLAGKPHPLAALHRAVPPRVPRRARPGPGGALAAGPSPGRISCSSTRATACGIRPSPPAGRAPPRASRDQPRNAPLDGGRRRGLHPAAPALAAGEPRPDRPDCGARFDVDGPGRTIALAWRASDPRAAGLAHLAAFFRAHAPAGTAPCRDTVA